MYLGFDQIEEDLRDTNKERNLKSTDPVFCNKFKNEWDEVTSKLKANYEKIKRRKPIDHESIRYSSSGISFR